MHVLRAFLRRHRALAALVVAAALCMKALLPAGYMIGHESMTLTVELCTDASGAKVTKQITVAKHGGPGEKAGSQAQASEACPYAGLAMPALAGADTALLALALAFILALGFAPLRPAPQRRFHHVLPPLRGPPAFA